MKGRYRVVVRTNRVQYKFTVNRNITILNGDSATGKTTLIDMVGDYDENGSESGVWLECDRPCRVLAGRDWKARLAAIEDSIVFIDEGNEFITTKEFAEAIAQTSNYYVIATREPLFELPYSVEEIYGIRNRTRKRYEHFSRYYISTYLLFNTEVKPYRPNEVIVEDSGSGYRFFKALCDKAEIRCVSAGGKDNILRLVRSSNAESILVIADGAAFGPEMERVHAAGRARGAQLYLPESFEWLILSSGLIKDDELPKLLENPSEFIESRDYFSWEQFFTAMLTRMTRNTPFAYQKKRLLKAYLDSGSVAAVRAVMHDVGL